MPSASRPNRGPAMNELPAAGRSALQRLVARGFTDPLSPDQRPELVADHRPASTGLPKVAVILPTMSDRPWATEMVDYLTGLAGQVAIAAKERAIEIHLYVAVQYPAHDAVQGKDSARRIEAVLREGLGDDLARIGLTVMTLAGPGKVVSINAVTKIASTRGVEAVLLIDDDVAFSEGCFSRMIAAYLESPRPIAIGARKIGQPFQTRASSVLHKLKSFTQPAENYPHACCMIVSMDVIAPEIPPIYSSDDGYICFRLLAAEQPNPLARLVLIEEAYCYHWVGGRDAGEITSRVRRMLLHHHLFLSHGRRVDARYYLAELLFFGMWPLVPFDRTKGFRRGAIKCLLKYVYALWFAKIGVELILRGLSGRPLREIVWGGLRPRAETEMAI